jgi:hypothetical protein
MSEARRLVWWKTTELETIKKLLSHAHRSWCEGWGVEALEDSIEISNANSQLDVSEWLRIGEGLGLASREKVGELIARTLWGDEHTSTLCVLVTERALNDWCAALRSALQLSAVPASGATPAGIDSASGSGAVVVKVLWPGGQAQVLLSGVVVGRLIKRVTVATGAPLAPFPVKVAAALKPFDLQVTQQLGLRAGDVIQLPHRLDEPLELCGEDGQCVARAWLGARDQHRALLLTASDSQG